MKATQLLRGEIETDSIWAQNLDDLDAVSGFNIIETSNGTYDIEYSFTP